MSAAGNALRAVRLLHENDELRVMDVADQLGVARSTAHRILAMLVFEGFAEQDRHKVYRPGPALRAIRGSQAAPPPDLITVAHPHLQRLAETVRETTHLMVLEGNGTRFLDGVEGPQALRAYNLQESERGVSAVGACVRDRTGTAVAAVAVAAPSARCPRGRLTELAQPLLAVARDISGGL